MTNRGTGGAKPTSARVALDRLADALIEDIMSMTDEEIIAEAIEDGIDPEENAKRMREIFERACMLASIRTGDHVLHKPSGETWVVAGVWPDEDRISWCGWPEGFAKLSDCELVRAATDEEHRAKLEAMAKMTGNDHRARYARRLLGQ